MNPLLCRLTVAAIFGAIGVGTVTHADFFGPHSNAASSGAAVRDRSGAKWEVVRFRNGQLRSIKDNLTAEEPLEIRLCQGRSEAQLMKSLSVTIRTPGNDRELAVGFLATDGVIRNFGYHSDRLDRRSTIGAIRDLSNDKPSEMQCSLCLQHTSSRDLCGCVGKLPTLDRNSIRHPVTEFVERLRS